VPADSSIKSIQDLRGKKVAIFKGTNIQLAVAKILEGSGLTEKDIRAINMDTATTKAALITKDIDAAFGGNDLLALRDQGTARIIYTTRGGDARLFRHGASSIKTRASPLIDDYVAAQYRKAIADSKRFGLIKNDFSFDAWTDTSFLKQVLKELNLEHYWQEYDASGKPKG